MLKFSLKMSSFVSEYTNKINFFCQYYLLGNNFEVNFKKIMEEKTCE